ncbi:CobW family GTP-binding protein [Usitatibacter palustris]|uniref:P-loop guanosine triphosphatase YjiA n=1 Tax=Usitatibacter palustris TaxID=2732487 RepID=A0A6M4HCJ1_9PROT|nr:GTP-binding protein [Usitatibacter palustris]QJR16293.1 P-loop guanosine triphosphatase YjiA [Usitatibacter palustris]
MPATPVTPITVLTGFLGSGKTTLLNHALRDAAFADTAVLVNEFGQIGIDHLLVREASENVVLLEGGCICCQVAGDVVQALRDLHFKRAEGSIPLFRRAVIETTGLADPAPLLRTLIEMPLVAARYSLAGVVTTVDADHGARTLDAHPEAVKQVAVADRVILTKTDLVDAAQVEAITARIAAMVPGVPVERAVKGVIAPERLFASGLGRPAGETPDAAGWFGRGWRSHASGVGAHDRRIRSFVWHHDGDLDWETFATGLETLLELRGDRILRLKGLVNVAGEPGPRAIHAVQHSLYPPAKLAAWPDGPDFADRHSRIVFITRDLEEAPVAQILNSFASRNPACSPPPITSSP